MVYTRFKCDRYWVFVPKLLLVDYPMLTAITFTIFATYWRYFSYCSEETERMNAWWAGYPWWRDPIAKRKEDKFKRIIRDNNVDIFDPKWTGVSKSHFDNVPAITEEAHH